MDEESKTTDGRRRWRQWTEEQARAALNELVQSGVSVAKFAESKGVSAQRIAYWKKRLGETAPTLVEVRLPVSTPRSALGSPRSIEIASGGVAVRVREDLDVEHLARIVDALARRHREC